MEYNSISILTHSITILQGNNFKHSYTLRYRISSWVSLANGDTRIGRLTILQDCAIRKDRTIFLQLKSVLTTMYNLCYNRGLVH